MSVTKFRQLWPVATKEAKQAIAVRWQWTPAPLAAGISLLVYLWTLAPTVFTLDSAELTIAAFSLGLVHAPGYPVYLLLGHLFTYLPLGDVGYRVNLLSALAGAGAVGLLVLIGRQLTGRMLPAIAAGLSYAACYYVWAVSVVAEVYTLQGLFLAGILWALLRWWKTGEAGWVVVAGGLAGLALANNPATALWWPGLFLLVLASHRCHPLTRGDWFRAAALFVVAATPVLYLPLRSLAQTEFVQVGQFDQFGHFHPLDLSQPKNLVWYLSGRQFGPQILSYTLGEYGEQGVQFLHRLWAGFLGIGLPLGVWGILRLWQRNRSMAAGLALTVVPHTLFFIGYRVIDKDTMFLPVFLVWAIFLAIGLDRVLSGLPGRLPAVGLLLPVALFLVNLSYANVSHFRVPYDTAMERLQRAGPNAIILATWGDAEIMRYHQMVSRIRPDVTIANIFFASPQVLPALTQNWVSAGRNVYATRELPGLASQFRFVKVGASYRVLVEGRTP